MSTQELKTIAQLKTELESDIRALVEAFQRHPQCRGVQVRKVAVHQIDLHNGYDPSRINHHNPDLKSDAYSGYRVSRVEIIVVLP